MNPHARLSRVAGCAKRRKEQSARGATAPPPLMTVPQITIMLGLSLKLSPEAITSLQSRQSTAITPVQEEEEEEDPLDDDNRNTPENYNDEIIEAPITSLQQDGEDWDDTIAVPPEYLQEVSDNESDNFDDASHESDDEISLAPPPSLPLVVVNLERLCGFIPSTREESEQLRQQVVEALSRDDDDGIDDSTEQVEHNDTLSRHFDARVKELFENGVANHGDTSSVDERGGVSHAVIQYPEFLCRNDTDPPTVIVTARQWKRLLHRHKISVVDKVLSHLKDCNQPLSWKVDMHEELLKLVKSEDSYRKLQQEQKSLHHWRMERRKQELDKLYQVRETFDHRLEAAREKEERLEMERDDVAAKELRSLRLSKGESGGLEALDFDTNIFSFEETVAERNDCIGHFHDECNDGKVSSDDGYDNEAQSDGEESYSGNNIDNIESLDNTTSLPAVDLMERSRVRRKAAQKSQRRRLQSQQEAAKEMALIEQAHAEEERVREACTTPELQMAQATVKSLEARMQQVDDLLESLQEEEWADEEQGILQTTEEYSGSNVHDRATSSSTPTEANTFSLLDSVLAMILGSLPRPDDTLPEKHYRCIRKEHQVLVDEWKEYFGRLPVSFEDCPADQVADASDDRLSAEMEQMKQESLPTAAELRQSLGIFDNLDQNNWDDVDDWDALLTSDTNKSESRTSASTLKTTKAKPVVGLRPGGKVSR